MAKGSRGGQGGSGGGGRQGGKGIKIGDILETREMLSAVNVDNKIVSGTLTVAKKVNDEYNETIAEFQLAKLKPGVPAIAYYDGANIAINERFANSSVMNREYDKCVKDGYHPSRGKYSGTEAVAAHEFGHALTDAVGKKLGITDIDKAAKRIVNEARKITKDRGVVIMANKISRYATVSNAEAVAEAYTDVFCNGAKAAAQSTVIVSVIDKYLK